MVRSKRKSLLWLLWGAIAVASTAWAQSSNNGANPGTATQQNVPTTAEVRQSQAERMLRLEQSIA
jgi:hypothetical protein